MNPLHPSRDPYGNAHLFLHMQRRPVWKKLYQHYVPKWVDWALVIAGAVCLITMGLYSFWKGQ